MSEQKEEVELKISYDGAVLNDGEYVEEIQCQPGLVLVNGKKYMSNQGYQIKYLFDEYQQLGLEMKDVDDEFEEKENELRELLRAFEIQSYD